MKTPDSGGNFKLLQSLKEIVETLLGKRGNELDRAVTVRDLVNSGLAKYKKDAKTTIQIQKATGKIVATDEGAAYHDTPPRVESITAVGSMGVIHLSFKSVRFPHLARYQIYRAIATPNDPEPSFGQAVFIGATKSTETVYPDEVGKGTGNQIYYYWVRAESKAGKLGPIQTKGIKGQTSYSPEYVLSILTKKWQAGVVVVAGATPSYVIPNPENSVNLWFKCITGGLTGSTEPVWPTTVGGTVIDGAAQWEAIAVPTELPPFLIGEVNGQPAVIMDQAFIGDATITNAMIENLAADKITAGTITASIEMLAATLTGGLIRTTNTTATRVEIENGSFLIWAGTGVKSDANALFYVDNTGAMKLRDASGRLLISASGTGALQTQEVGFRETFEHIDADLNWEKVSGYGGQDAVITLVSSGETGGNALSLYQVDATEWRAHKYLIPFDQNKLHKIRFRAKKPSGAGLLYVGFLGVAADGVTLVNSTGANSLFGSGHYFHCSDGSLVPSGYTTYTGYTKGFGSPNGTTAVGTLASPGKVHQNVRYLRPFYIANYEVTPTPPEETIIDYFIVEEIPTASVWADGLPLDDLKPAEAGSDVTDNQPLARNAADENLVVDGFFDFNGTTWQTIEGTTTPVSVVTDATEGKCLDLPETGIVYAQGSKTFRVVPGSRYEVRIRAWSPGSGSAQLGFYFRIQYKNSFAEPMTSIVRDSLYDFIVGSSAVLTGTPTTYSYTWTAPANANWANVACYNWSQSAVGFRVAFVELIPLESTKKGIESGIKTDAGYLSDANWNFTSNRGKLLLGLSGSKVALGSSVWHDSVPQVLFEPDGGSSYRGFVGDYANEKYMEFDGADFGLGWNSILRGTNSYSNDALYIDEDWRNLDSYTLTNFGDGVSPSIATPGFMLQLKISSGTFISRSAISRSWNKFYGFPLFSFSEKLRFKTSIKISPLSSTVDFNVILNKSANNLLGFAAYYSSGVIKLYGRSGDDTTTSDLELMTLSASTEYEIEVIFTPATNIKYYVDGVLKGTKTTRLPVSSTDNFSAFQLDAYDTTATHGATTVYIGRLKIEQQV